MLDDLLTGLEVAKDRLVAVGAHRDEVVLVMGLDALAIDDLIEGLGEMF